MIISEKDFQQFVKGDEKSFETIFCQYYKTLVSYVMRHDLVAMEAEDIVIETFHHIWQIREDLKSPAALHSLLFTATRNRTLNVARNLKNRQNHKRKLFGTRRDGRSLRLLDRGRDESFTRRSRQSTTQTKRIGYCRTTRRKNSSRDCRRNANIRQHGQNI